MKLQKKIIGISLCATLALQMQVFAKDSTKQSESLGSVDIVSTNATEDTNSYTIESMNTSTKLNLSVRHTPQSVSVLTTQKLQDLGISSYQNMLSRVTGVTLNRWDERINASARGFDIDYYKVDGLPTYSTYNERDLDLFMFDRVEIVRGANGLTTGAGNPAISINLVRKRANSKEFKGNISLETGSWSAYGLSADVSSGLNESGTVRGRVAIKYENEDSFMDSYERENNIFFGVIDADLSETTYLSAGTSYQKLNRSGIRWGGLPAFYSDGTRADFDKSITASDDWTYWDSEVKSVFLNLEQILYKDISVNAAYSFDEIDANTALLYFAGSVNKEDGSGISYMDWEAETQKKQHNLDVNVNVPFEMAGLSQEFIIGASYNKDETTKYVGRYPNGYYSTLDNFYDYDLDLPAAADTDTPYILEPEEIEQKAIYLAGNFSLTPELKFIAGARLSSWEYTSSDSSKESREFDNELTPYVGLVYDLDNNHSVYTSYTSIFNPQDKKGVDANYLDPIEGKNYEVGVKGEYFDGALNTSLSVFKIEQDNVAEAIDGVFVDGNVQAYKGVAGVTSEGFEIDISGKVTDNFSLDFGFANFKAEDADGNKYNTKASRTTANIFAKYLYKDFTFGAGLNYKSKYYTGSGATQITQDAFTIANAMLGYKFNKNTKVQVNIDNLFDKEYYEGIGNNSMVYGEPRRVTLALKYTF